ncbi:MAG: cyclic pyranopterin monophosphate synthase MoaC, partial [Xanthomonadales bacterium]|nr:cyclic pyranopterin monophosphate synthase MoaC [Xanthomonadales bacterium]NIX11645.1 cyclic pyranopterin monophosphate synthase MoaC [Xanthomonadales bacterium]
MSGSDSSRRDFSMADVSAKAVTRRRALAAGRIRVGDEALALIQRGALPKGDALAMAEVAGIMAAKATPSLLPLCHPLSLNRVRIRSVLRPGQASVEVFCLAEIDAKTGVEMEALCGLQVALLTIWDLVKPVNPALEIDRCRLLYKSGGKRGTWRHPEGVPDEAAALLED